MVLRVSSMEIIKNSRDKTVNSDILILSRQLLFLFDVNHIIENNTGNPGNLRMYNARERLHKLVCTIILYVNGLSRRHSDKNIWEYFQISVRTSANLMLSSSSSDYQGIR